MNGNVDIGSVSSQLRRLSEIEARINQNLTSADFRTRLFADPVNVLREEGIILPEDRAAEVTSFFQSARVPASTGLRVSTNVAAPAISVSIGIEF